MRENSIACISYIHILYIYLNKKTENMQNWALSFDIINFENFLVDKLLLSLTETIFFHKKVKVFFSNNFVSDMI